MFWFLTVIQNAIVLDQAIPKAYHDRIPIRDGDLKHILPTMVEHINYVDRFDIDINRRPPKRTGMLFCV
jgi:hypothetical protein